MSYEIISTEQDIAGKHRARVMMPNGDTRFFKFDSSPSQEEVDAVVDAALAAEANDGSADSSGP